MRIHPVWPLPLLLGLAACDTPRDADGGQFGQETNDGATCAEVERTPLDDDEVSPLGFSPADLKSWLVAAHTAPLTWSDATATDITVTLSGPSAADYVTYVAEYPAGMEDANLALDCPAQVELVLATRIETGDGALDEALELTVQATDADAVDLWLELEDLSGTFDPWDWADADYDEVWADLRLALRADTALSGAIEGRGEQTYGTGPDSAVSLTLFEIATIGSGSEAD